MGRRTAVSLVAAVVAAASVACGPVAGAGSAALQVPPGCERYLTVADVEAAMGRPVAAVLSDDGEDCRFVLGAPGDAASVAVIVDIPPGSADLPGLRAVDLDALPPHGAQIASYYEVGAGRETLLALSGEAFYELIAESHPAGGSAPAGVRPRLVGLAKTVATRL